MLCMQTRRVCGQNMHDHPSQANDRVRWRFVCGNKLTDPMLRKMQDLAVLLVDCEILGSVSAPQVSHNESHSGQSLCKVV